MELEEMERNEEMYVCEHCGESYSFDEINNVTVEGHEQQICDSCLENQYEQCEQCGDYVRNGWGYTVDDYDTWCEHCFNEYSYTCTDCGNAYSSSAINWYRDECYCDDCYARIIDEQEQYVEGYHHTRANHFFKLNTEESHKLFFGIELEIDKNDDEDRNVCAKEIKELNPYFYTCKYDGSLDYGFEIVSQPASYEYHLQAGWDKVCQIATSYDFRSHDRRTCGLHIHVSRNYFHNDSEALVKLWEIFLRNRPWLERFSRRKWEHLDRWAKFKDSSELEYMNKNYREYYSGRYQAINNENDYTIEFRLFRGTLKYNTFVASLQLVKYLCEYVNNHSMQDCRRLNLSQVDFSEYSELVEYIGERNLPTLELENIPEYKSLREELEESSEKLREILFSAV